jgi:hypothetical protein
MLQAEKLTGSRPDEVNEYFNVPNPSSHIRSRDLLSLY